jgi:hypothetical protein
VPSKRGQNAIWRNLLLVPMFDSSHWRDPFGTKVKPHRKSAESLSPGTRCHCERFQEGHGGVCGRQRLPLSRNSSSDVQWCSPPKIGKLSMAACCRDVAWVDASFFTAKFRRDHD